MSDLKEKIWEISDEELYVANDSWHVQGKKDFIEAVMSHIDQHAQERAVAFAEWVKCDKRWDRFDEGFLSTAELYALFVEEIKTNPI